jgi:uncharacterized integral membrane protein
LYYGTSLNDFKIVCFSTVFRCWSVAFLLPILRSKRLRFGWSARDRKKRINPYFPQAVCCWSVAVATKKEIPAPAWRRWTSSPSVALSYVVHTPLALVGVILSVPMLPVLIVFTEVTRRMTLSDAAMTVALPVSLVIGGSVIYGALVLAVLWLRDRKEKATAHVANLP